MALQIRRGTAAQRLAAGTTPAAGEPWFTYDDGQLYIGDGVTAGGVNVGANVPIEALTNVTTIKEAVRTIQSFSIASNVALITLTANHNYYAGLELVISGSSTALLNGTYTIVSIISANGFAINKTNANIAQTNTNGTITPRVATGETLIWDQANGYWESGLPLMDLDDLSNVDLTTTAPIAGDLLRYNSAVQQFRPSALKLDVLDDVNTTTNVPVSGSILRYNVGALEFRPAALTIDALDDVNTSSVAPTNGQALIYNTSTSLWVPGTVAPPSPVLFTAFRYNPVAKPTTTVANSILLGGGSLGTWSEKTFANLAINSEGPTSATYNPTLTGITFDTTDRQFEGFAIGKYLITGDIYIEINKTAATTATEAIQACAAETGATGFYYTSFAAFPILPYASYGSVMSSYNITFSLTACMESATLNLNAVSVLLNENQSGAYWVKEASIHFIKIA